MSVRIVVEKGPDSGRIFQVSGQDEMRLGRGAGYHFSMKDSSWQGGLRVECGDGVFKVTNDMATSIYMGKEPFAPGEQRIWYNGARLQPTAETILALYVDVAKEETKDRRGLEEVTAPAKSGVGRKQVEIAVIVVCSTVALIGFLLPNDVLQQTTHKTPEQLRNDFGQLNAALQELRTDPDLSRPVDVIAPQLREARFCELWNRRGEAYDRYVRVRNELDRVLNQANVGGKSTRATLARAREFVNKRLLDLAATRTGWSSP